MCPRWSGSRGNGMDKRPEQELTATSPGSDRSPLGPEVQRASSISIIERLAAAALPPFLERPESTERSEGRPSFARGLWRIATADVSSGNKVVLLRDGAETFATMLEMIAAAKRSVNLEGYIFRNDEVGQQFADAMVAAAGRGVAVRLLVDWIGRLGTPRRFFNAMARDGVAVRLFNPPGF